MQDTIREEVDHDRLDVGVLLADTLAGLFDGPTTAPLDFSAPIQTVDVSRLEGRGDEALALVLSCLSSWGQAAVDDPSRGADDPPRLVVRGATGPGLPCGAGAATR
jgi:hypothetical protein